MEQNIDKETIQELVETVKEIHVALCGDKKYGHQGIITRVENLEKTKEKWSKKIEWMYGYLTGMSVLGAVAIEFIKEKFLK